ncbi:hypothetical protein TRFO_27268 [Tritrichomonas foetus]|uniref:TFIID subunit TAF5 NTD2 domain-containing protein n=1 Tax=Tritrichomonas foetus TaxID=1144522 RepID=A0A1J4K2U9_9EUKA|nr:hypothetical protein TRFO_27268 [Tritrichomonas foetus]|eukprot:OHT05136.1 hypothetical protein TRFO_27268 [Tritrichomonas foetus]
MNSSMKDSFFQMFNYDDKASPFGASLDEMMKSCPFVESTPTRISICAGSSRDLPLPVLYQCYLSFARKHPKSKPIQEVLFPLFCHICIHFRLHEETESYNEFTEKNTDTLPEDFKDEISEFLKLDPNGKYHELSCLFSTQLYILKMDIESYKLLNEFLNIPKNSKLRRFITDIITVDILHDEVEDKLPSFTFPYSSPTTHLNILNAKIREASFAAILPDMSSIYMSLYDTQICKIDKFKRTFDPIYSHPSCITSLSISNQANILLSTDLSGNAFLYSQGKVTPITASLEPIWCSTFAPQGGAFAIGSDDMLVKLYDASTQEPFRVMPGHTSPVTSVAFHPNCSLLGSLAFDSGFRIWDIREAQSVRIFIGKHTRNNSLSFSPDGKMAAFYDGELELCDIGTGEFITRKPMKVPNVRHIFFSKDSQFLYAVGAKGEIGSVNLRDGSFNQEEICRIDENVVSCNFSKSGDLIVVSFSDRQNNMETGNI